MPLKYKLREFLLNLVDWRVIVKNKKFVLLLRSEYLNETVCSFPNGFSIKFGKSVGGLGNCLGWNYWEKTGSSSAFIAPAMTLFKCVSVI